MSMGLKMDPMIKSSFEILEDNFIRHNETLLNKIAYLENLVLKIDSILSTQIERIEGLENREEL